MDKINIKSLYFEALSTVFLKCNPNEILAISILAHTISN